MKILQYIFLSSVALSSIAPVAAQTTASGTGQRVQLAVTQQVNSTAASIIPSWLSTGQMPVRDITPTTRTPNYFALSLVIPAPEEVKERHETLSANFAFEGQSARLDASYGGNAAKLLQIERTVEQLKTNRNIQIQAIRIVGYTSVDGYIDENSAISQERARMIAEYFSRYYNYPVSYYWRGEDWTGLRELVNRSSIVDKSQVINIIDNTEDINLRKILLRRLSNGNTYRTMQSLFFPTLRRTDYSIIYTVKNFDLAESRIAIQSEPQLLSLNELYTLAVSYQPDSREFLEIFDVASHLYPTDITSRINRAALDILDGAAERAISILQYLSDPAAINNMGVAYARMGDIPRAVVYFEQASRAGNPDAINNLRLARYWGF